jgi:pyruvate formate lyase activating enzyme
MSDESLRECAYWQTEGDKIVCGLCPRKCRIAEGATGVCRVRKNVGGTLRSTNYARVTSVALDPIEKKPLYHFHPGAQILSLGTFGCNLSCRFCQNWQISQGSPPTQALSPDEAVQTALEMAGRGNIGIAYTYNEPIIWFEYVRDTAALAREAGLKNVMVTNGLIEEEPLEELLGLVDAFNVDIKSMDDDFYRRLCGIGSGAVARRTVEQAFGRAAVEITCLLVTDENDGEDDVRALVDWAASVSPDLPLHLSGYRPAYKHNAPPTPIERIVRAVEIGREKLNYVYAGNVMIAGGDDTICPRCGETVIERHGYTTTSRLTADGRCAKCGGPINAVV